MNAATRVVIVVFLIILPGITLAQFNRTAVSVNGADANPCTTTSPCRSFGRAISQTNEGGEVLALDSGGYGPFTVNKTITVQAIPGAYAGISALLAGTDGVSLDLTGGKVIIVRGLTITGLGASNGINVLSNGKAFIENCVINGFVNNGVRLDGFSTASVFITNTTVRNCGASGIVAANTNGRTFIDHCYLEGNTGEGLLVAGNLNVMVRDTVAAGNGYGYRMDAGSAVLDVEECVAFDSATAGFAARANGNPGVFMHLERCRASGNSTGITAGVSAVVFPAIVRVSNSTITNNSTGVVTLGSGSILSRGNNTLEQNNAGNTFSASTFVAK